MTVYTIIFIIIFKLRIKRLTKRWKHSGGNVINEGQVDLVSTCCRYQTLHIPSNKICIRYNMKV